MIRAFEVSFLRAPLLIRVAVQQGAALSGRAYTVAEARDLARRLNTAADDGERFIAENVTVPGEPTSHG